MSFTSKSFQIGTASIPHWTLETQRQTEMLSLFPWDSHTQVSDGTGLLGRDTVIYTRVDKLRKVGTAGLARKFVWFSP